MVIGTLIVDGWAVTLGTAKRGLGGLWPHPVPTSLYQECRGNYSAIHPIIWSWYTGHWWVGCYIW